MKVPRIAEQRFAARSQHTHYYKSVRLEKVASPVKKNEKPLLELLHFPNGDSHSVPPTPRHAFMTRPKSSLTLGSALSRNPASGDDRCKIESLREKQRIEEIRAYVKIKKE
jgi:hypothetical protein